MLCGFLAAACDSGGTLDAGPPDAGRDAGRDAAPPALDAGPDAGPAPTRELALDWVTRVTCAQSLGGVAEARLAPLADEGFLLSLTTGGAPTAFAAGEPAERTIGDATTPVTQAAAWYDAAGALQSARPIATASAPGFAALGYAVATTTEGDALFAGRFTGAGFFGGVDPARVALATTVEMPDEETTLIAAEGYLARFGADRRIVSARGVESARGADDHRLVDLAVLEDGAILALGLATGEASIDGTALAPTAGAAGEVFVARWSAAGVLDFVARVRGTSTPVRLAVFADGSFAALVRYAGAPVVGAGELTERALPAPPEGTLSWDAVLRFDATGALAWARPVGSDATSYPGLRDLRPHADGSLTVVGTFRGLTAWPDAPDLPPQSIALADGLVARLDAAGEILWQARLRAARSLLVQALEAAGGDESWVLLTVGPEGATFELAEGPPLALPESTENARLALLRLDGDGALRAGQLLAHTDVDGDDLLALPSGDLILVGRYGDGTTLEPGTAAERALPTALAERNVFVARYRR